MKSTYFFTQKGAALISVLGISVLILFIIQGLWMSSQLEYTSSHRKLLELQARYNVRSGMELSLLRLAIYNEGARAVENQPLGNMLKPYLDLLWAIPFMWPLPVPEEALKSDKDSLEEIKNNSF